MNPQGLIRPHYAKLLLLLRSIDIGLIALALAAVLGFNGDGWTVSHSAAAILAGALFALLGDALGTYTVPRGTPLKREAFRIVATWSLVVVGLLVAVFFSKTSHQFSRFGSLLWFVAAPVLLVVWRLVWRLILQEVRLRGRNTRTCV